MNDLNDFQKNCSNILETRKILIKKYMEEITNFLTEITVVGLDFSINITFPKITLYHFISPPKYVCKLEMVDCLMYKLIICEWTRVSGLIPLGVIYVNGDVDWYAWNEKQTLDFKHIANLITENKEYVQNSIIQILKNHVEELHVEELK